MSNYMYRVVCVVRCVLYDVCCYVNVVWRVQCVVHVVVCLVCIFSVVC